jgi:hypothetical protein
VLPDFVAERKREEVFVKLEHDETEQVVQAMECALE